jgi:arylsulfatase A
MKWFALIFFMLLPVAAAEPPNVVMVLIDDMGLNDTGCFGSDYYQTPHIDKLAEEGMKFTQAYSAATVCSPTRGALMTGKYPARLHLTDWIAGHNRPDAKLRIPEWTKELKAGERTIATVLKEKGYVTGHIGKWHLKRSATDFGFDTSIADNGIGQPATFLSPYENANLPDGPPGEELTERLTTEAVRFIETNKTQPFFLYLSHYAVHQPLGGKSDVIEKYRERAKRFPPQGPPAYAAMVEAVDDSVGRIRSELQRLGLSDNTVIIFTSDNGGLIQGKPPTTTIFNARAGKGSAYEGGVRVPAIVLWPGLTKPGTESTTPVITMDWTATIAAAVGTDLSADGVDVRPLLRDQTIPDRPLFWHYPHYHPGGATPYSAIREGSWVLRHFYEDERNELYHLAEDPKETTDLSAKEAGRAEKMMNILAVWRASVDAQLPTPNPNFKAK